MDCLKMNIFSDRRLPRIPFDASTRKKIIVMKKKLFIFLFIMMLCVSCNNVDKYAKNDLLGVKKIEEGLYWETYCVYRGGVYAGNIYTRYLTDSISFRLLVLPFL